MEQQTQSKRNEPTPPATEEDVLAGVDPDELEDGTHFFRKLQAEVGAWSQKNFGDQPAWRPAMGMVEELCELSEKFEDLDLAETLDAIGDTAIYMADYFHRRGWDLGETWCMRYVNPRRYEGPNMGKTLALIRDICHSHLKGDQGIRGGAGKHDIVLRQACAAALVFIQDTAGLLDRDICEVITNVWDVVSKRDWTKNPTNAHEVAAASVLDNPKAAAASREVLVEIAVHDKEGGIGGFTGEYGGP